MSNPLPTPEALGDLHGKAAPPVRLEPFTRAELCERLRGGEEEADLCEKLLAWASRARGGIDLAIGEGLAALRVGNRLRQLGFHFADYAREVLGMKRRAAEGHARLAEQLRDRPLLREALRSGRVLYRAAEEILPVAKGAAEAAWVDRAVNETVRALRAEVRAARAMDASEDEEEWVRLSIALRPEEREVVDEALSVADRLMPGTSRVQRLEAMGQEFLGAAGAVAPEPERARLGAAFGTSQPTSDDPARREERERELELETDRWAHLPAVPAIAAPAVDFDALTTADEIDLELRKLARQRDELDRHIGFAACALKESRVHELEGFASFRHYCAERLGLSGRAVEQRARLEKGLWERPALREAQASGLSYAKLLLLARLPDGEVRAWTSRAQALTCIQLVRELDAAETRQMRAHRRLVAPMPRSTALLLAAAMEAVRRLSDTPVSDGKCLALIARHFLNVWEAHVTPVRTRSQRVRARDVWCQVPGCSHRASDAHHIRYRSQGGGDGEDNLVGVCAYHHHRSIHPGHLRLTGTAPTALVWVLGGKTFTGGPA